MQMCTFHTQHGTLCILLNMWLFLYNTLIYSTCDNYRKDFVSSGTQAVDSDYESPADTNQLIVSQVRIHKALFYLQPEKN